MSLFEYTDGETTFEGYIAFADTDHAKRPCVLVGHAWDGPNTHFQKMADEFASKGLVAIAIDVYGKGKRGRIDGDNSHLMKPLLDDRQLLLRRVLAAFAYAQQHPLVDPNRIAMIGHCFGGLCALDLARAAPKGLRGVISVHGLLIPPPASPKTPMDVSVLVLHGWEDPVVSLESVLNFTSEMTERRADWQLHAYGHTKHAFTFANANYPELGIQHNPTSSRRAMIAVDNFLREVLRGAV